MFLAPFCKFGVELLALFYRKDCCLNRTLSAERWTHYADCRIGLIARTGGSERRTGGSQRPEYCKEHGIHLNGPKLGKPYADPAIQKQQKKLEWQESGERGEIERNFGVGKRRYCLDRIVTKLKETSEVMIYASVLYMNLRKKLRLLLRLFFSWLRNSIQIQLERATLALA